MEKLKFGDHEDTLFAIEPEDLQAFMSLGLVIHFRQGSLIQLREQLEEVFAQHVKYKRISTHPLYVVNWMGLSEELKEDFKKGVR